MPSRKVYKLNGNGKDRTKPKDRELLETTPTNNSQGLEGEEHTIYCSPRSIGKTSKKLMDFYIECRKKRAIMLSTTDGTIYSQKAHDNLITKAKEQAQLELLDRLEANGSGGGNWRRLITQERARITKGQP